MLDITLHKPRSWQTLLQVLVTIGYGNMDINTIQVWIFGDWSLWLSSWRHYVLSLGLGFSLVLEV